jgi:hypothetical protein
MCGIAGFFKVNPDDSVYTKEKDKKIHEILTKIFEDTKPRGSDASGFSWLNKFGELKTVKGPVSSDDLVKESKWKALAENLPLSLIAHCRAWTQGEPFNNFNNHPIIVNKEMALIHNGCISNDDEVKGQCITQAKGEVDSEAIPLSIQTKLFDQLGDDFRTPEPLDIVKAINETGKDIYGGYACAFLHKATPEFMYLFDHNNPVVLAYVPELDVIFFASETDIIMKAFKVFLPQEEQKTTFFKFFGFSKPKPPRYSIDRLADDTIVVMGLAQRNILAADGKTLGTTKKFDIDFYALDSTFGRNKTRVITPQTPAVTSRSSGAHYPEEDEYGDPNIIPDDIYDLTQAMQELAPVTVEEPVAELVEESKLVTYEMPKKKMYLNYSYNNQNPDVEDWRESSNRASYHGV